MSGVHATAVAMPVYRPADDWDRDYLLDVASAAPGNAYDLCGQSALVAAICKAHVMLDAELRGANERAAELERELDALRADRVVAIERITAVYERIVSTPITRARRELTERAA
jgi:hypothetical protein